MRVNERDDRVPLLMVDDNWPVDDIYTLEEADDAAVILRDAIASIQFQLDAPPRDGVVNQLWQARARLAMRLKEAALKEVEIKRERLSKTAFQDYVIVRVIKDHVDRDTFDAWAAEARERYPDVFE